jgi:hypothetical protein
MAGSRFSSGVVFRAKYTSASGGGEQENGGPSSLGIGADHTPARADTVWQTNRAMDNNITGLRLPQSVVDAKNEM